MINNINNNVDFDKSEKEYFKNYYLEMGKNIGRNGMMKYLHEANELDSNVIIDDSKLMKIEDEIENRILNKKELKDKKESE